jgi:NNP family nitrate/nitrite transporter-like MFS transporter
MSQPTRRRWWVLTNVVLVNVVVTGIAWNYIIMFVPQVTADLGLEISAWGPLWSGIPLGVLLFSLPAGALGDRFGVRASLATGLLIVAASLALRVGAGGAVTMFLSMVGFGLGLALVMSSFPKAIAVAFPASELGMANGFAQAGVGVGLGSATVLAPLLADTLGGWRGLSLTLSAASLAMALLWFVSFRDAAGGDRASEAASPGSSPMRSLLAVLRIRQVRLVALCYALYMGGYLGAIGYLPTHLTTSQGLSPEAAGALLSLGPWSFTLGSMLLPTISDRIGRRRAVYLPGMLGGGLALFAASLATGLPLAVSIAALGLGTGVVGLLFVIPVESEGVGEGLAATAVGSITAAGFLGGFLSPLLGMPLVGIDSTLGFGFWTLCFAASALLILRVRETGPKGR